MANIRSIRRIANVWFRLKNTPTDQDPEKPWLDQHTLTLPLSATSSIAAQGVIASERLPRKPAANRAPRAISHATVARSIEIRRAVAIVPVIA